MNMNIKYVMKAVLPNWVLAFIRYCRDYTPKEIKEDVMVNKALQNVKRRPHLNHRIKVAFIVQMAEIWDKESPIYEAMLSDPAFDPYLLVVPPSYDPESTHINTDYDKSNYFLTHYPSSIRSYQNGSWISVESMNFDYIFLQRPYDHYLPENFRSYNLVRFSKVCYIPYGFTGADVFNGGNSNKRFFRNIYFAFLESEYMVQVVSRKFRTKTEKNNHKILSLGYPALIPYFSFPPIKKISTILWTPRWSFDRIIGGSNFINYKECFIEAVKSHPEFKFIFRPHPLMFGEILSKGYMSQEEIDNYIGQITALGVIYDKNTPLVESLRNTDVLITDFSSIIIQFFLTGRPIIYCESSIQMNRTYQNMKDGMYLVHSKEDFISKINDLSIKGDYLKSKRQEIITGRFEHHKNATNDIINAIKQDYKETST